jgi:two-component system chemotaxis response regulator CheY
MIRILVVDDSPFVAAQITELLGEGTYEIVGHALSGEDGIRMYEELKPDLVTMDIIMPGIDGIEAAEEILKKDPSARIVMLSSLCDSSVLEEIKSKGMHYLIPKPLEKDLLLATLELAMK